MIFKLIIYKALDSLRIFGVIKSINDTIGGDLYIKYFDNYDSEENVCEGV